MSSGAVQPLVTDGRIHVGFDTRSRMWWAVGRLGSYGGHRSHAQVVRIAMDAAATQRTTVVLHNTKGRIIGTRAAAPQPSSQCFQDDTP